MDLLSKRLALLSRFILYFEKPKCHRNYSGMTYFEITLMPVLWSSSSLQSIDESLILNGDLALSNLGNTVSMRY